MPRLLAFITALAALSPAAAAPFDDIVREALAAEARLDTARALTLFLEAEQLQPEDAFILQKVARQYSDSVLDTDANDEKRRRLRRALDYAVRAAELAPDNPENVLSLAVVHGKLAAFEDVRSKIESSRIVREKAEQALRLDPSYDWAHHVLGRWHHEVSSLGAASRLWVRLVHGGLPPASVDAAIRHLETAVALAPALPAHHLELGFAYLAAAREADARAAFERGLALPSLAKHDEIAKARARAALEDLD